MHIGWATKVHFLKNVSYILAIMLYMLIMGSFV